MQPGDTISHFRIIERLGGGGMGVVFLAEDVSLERKVALKFLPGHLGSEESTVQRFRQEAIAASALEHPAICTIYEIGEAAVDSGGARQVFIAMAYYAGRTLREVLDEAGEGSEISRATALSVIQQVADGLSLAHSKGIVHRDVKPENILITHSGRAILLDFGIAKLGGSTRLTADGSVLGTVAYMAPEQIRGDRVDHRADVWALGVVAFEMLAGRRPFSGEYDQAIIYCILNEDPGGADALSDAVRPVLLRALAKDPEKRYPSISEFSKAIEATQKPQTVLAASEPPLRRRPAAILVAAALVAAVTSLVVWFSFGPGRTGVRDVAGDIGPATIAFRQLTAASELEEFPALSADGEQLVFSREIDGYRQLFIRNLETGAERQVTSEPLDHIQAAWSPSGESIVFVQASSQTGRIEPGDIYGAYNSGGDIWKLDLATGRARRIVEGAFHPVFSPDGRNLAFDAALAVPSQRLWLSDSEGRNPRQLTSDVSEDSEHIRPRWSPDGRLIVFQNQRRTKLDVEVIDVATREVSVITDDVYQNVNPVFAAGGAGIAFSSDRGGGMNVWFVTIDSDGGPVGSPRQLSTGAGNDVQLASSADGSWLVYSVLGINSDLWRLPVDPTTGRTTGAAEQLVASTREDSRGSWSSDDSAIAFNSDRGGDMNIWLFDVGEGAVRQLTRGPGGDYQPFWSPDDSTLAFFSARAGSPDIWTVRVASGELSRLTDDPGVEVNPSFSPEGRHIAYLSDRGGRREVWVMRSDGTEQRPLTSTGAGGHFLRWMPDGRLVVFSSEGMAKTVDLEGGEPELLVDVSGGAHMSFSPDSRLIADVVGHTAIWITPVAGGTPFVTYESADLDIRIDYPVWSSTGGWLLFDRVKPQGGDIWMISLLRN